MIFSKKKKAKQTFLQTKESKIKYLKLKKQFNVNWKAVAVAHNKSIEKVSSAGKIYFNQLANRCERQIKFFYKNIIK